jgi:hypothetical protein
MDDQSIANPLVSRHDDQLSPSDRRKPIVVEAPSRHVRKVGMPRIDHLTRVPAGEGLAERQIVLVDEELARHSRSGRQ